MLSAAGTNITGDLASVFLQYGVLGAFAIIALVFFRTVYCRETKRADRAEAALAQLNLDVREKVIPVLTEANRLVAEATALAREGRSR